MDFGICCWNWMLFEEPLLYEVFTAIPGVFKAAIVIPLFKVIGKKLLERVMEESDLIELSMKKKALMKKKQEQIIRKTIEIDSFFKSGSSDETSKTSTTCTVTIQSGKNETDFNFAAQLSDEQSTLNRNDNYVLGEDKSSISNTSLKIEDESQTQGLNNDQVQTPVNINKDPALWKIDDTLREIIARCDAIRDDCNEKSVT
ncbi:hypothetical protein WA026_014771 [Henosepilachna vigintioctopunctata]|uniref:Uncharacterized protein n=1 Tax=Henosepilachna vigintioctopunctata TaxID=420089 RepID=A0AAW1UU24_9CUCU